MPATMTEIAREARVSLPLVSRFLNNDATLRISEEKRLRIEQARKKLGGVRVHRAARSLSKKLAYNISIPYNRCFSPQWFQANIGSSEKFQAFEKTLRERDFRVSVNFFDPEHILEFFEDMAPSEGYCDGFLLETAVVDKNVARWILENRIPHVSTDARADRFEVNTISHYAVSGLRQSVEHLLLLGHRRVGYVGTGFRYSQFLQVMTEKEIPFRDEDQCAIPYLQSSENFQDFRQSTREAFGQSFRAGEGPTAYVCGNDYTAMGVIDVLRERGLSVGRDLSVIGFDNIEQRGATPSENPILTTVDVPFEQIGRRCAERLIEQITRGQRSIIHERIPVDLIIRSSTGICPVGR
ncbi:MAG: LacI family DNA-binding transcriptional regulator [Phycisphaerae bacterium]|nr:LacI family DNA-binding transcriptional regulator [Phycisphaerae bacterium]